MKLIQGNFGADNSGSYSAEVTEAGKLKLAVSGEFDVSAKIRDLSSKVKGEGFFAGLIRGGLNSIADSMAKKTDDTKVASAEMKTVSSGPVPSEMA